MTRATAATESSIAGVKPKHPPRRRQAGQPHAPVYAAPISQLDPDLSAYRLVRPGQAATLLGISLATLYRYVEAGKLPPPRRLSWRVSGWNLATILALGSGKDAS